MRNQPWPKRGIYHLKQSQYDEDFSETIRVLRWIRAYRTGLSGVEDGYEYIAICDRDMETGFNDFEGNALDSNAFIGEQGMFEQSQDNPDVLYAPSGYCDYCLIQLHQSLEDIEADNVFNGPNIEQEY